MSHDTCLFSHLISHRFTIFITYTSTTGNYRTTKICKYTCTCTCTHTCTCTCTHTCTCTCTQYIYMYMYMYTYIYMYMYIVHVHVHIHIHVHVHIHLHVQVHFYCTSYVIQIIIYSSIQQSANSENFLLNEDVTGHVFLNHISLHGFIHILFITNY